MADPRRVMLRPRTQAKGQVEMIKSSTTRSSATIPNCTGGDRKAKQVATSKNILLSNPQARATNVVLAGINPATRGTKPAAQQEIFSNAQARQTNVLLAGLQPPTPSTTQSRGWKVTETTINTTRVTSTGTYVQQKVKDFSVTKMAPTTYQGPVVIQTVQGRAQRDKPSTRNVSKVTIGSNLGPVRRPHVPENKPRIIGSDTRKFSKGIAVVDKSTIRRPCLPPGKPTRQSPSDVDTGTVIGPVPVKFPKRNEGNFRRNPVIGLFPGQEAHEKK